MGDRSSSRLINSNKASLPCNRYSTGVATLPKPEPNRDSCLKRGRQIVSVLLQTQTTSKFILSMGLRQAKGLQCSTKRTSRRAVWWWGNRWPWTTTSSQVPLNKTPARRTTTKVRVPFVADLPAITSFSAILRAPKIQMWPPRLLIKAKTTFKLRVRMAKNSQV